MAWELKEGQGSLFKNQRREKETHPHATGECMIDGVVYRVSAWIKEGKNGKFQSLAFRRKDEEAAPRSKPADKQQTAFDDLDEPPF